jgi:hypothetical protein
MVTMPFCGRTSDVKAVAYWPDLECLPRDYVIFMPGHDGCGRCYLSFCNSCSLLGHHAAHSACVAVTPDTSRIMRSATTLVLNARASQGFNTIVGAFHK